MQPADVPSGWKGTPYQPDPGDTSDTAAIMACVGARDTESDKVAAANSDTFSLGNAELLSEAVSYRSQSDVDSDVAALQSPKASSCYEQFLKKALPSSLPKGNTLESTSVKFTPGPAGGPANVVSTGTATIKVGANGQQLTTYLTLAFMTGPLIEAEVDTLNVGTPEPASLVNQLVATVAARSAKG